MQGCRGQKIEFVVIIVVVVVVVAVVLIQKQLNLLFLWVDFLHTIFYIVVSAVNGDILKREVVCDYISNVQ